MHLPKDIQKLLDFYYHIKISKSTAKTFQSKGIHDIQKKFFYKILIFNHFWDLYFITFKTALDCAKQNNHQKIVEFITKAMNHEELLPEMGKKSGGLFELLPKQKKDNMKQKNDFESKLQNQKNELEAKIQTQKNEFETKLQNQKKEFEEKLKSQKNEFEAKLQSQKNEFENQMKMMFEQMKFLHKKEMEETKEEHYKQMEERDEEYSKKLDEKDEEIQRKNEEIKRLMDNINNKK